MKNKKITIIACIEMLLLLVAGTYAWIEGTMNPGIEGRVEVSTSPGLIMVVDGNSVGGTIDINKYLTDASADFILKEVSSWNGIDFFIRTTPTNVSDEDMEEVYVRDATLSDRNQYYIYQSFQLVADNGAQDIYLDASQCNISFVSGQTTALDAIRVSLVVSRTNLQDQTYVFWGGDTTRSVLGIKNFQRAGGLGYGQIYNPVTNDGVYFQQLDAVPFATYDVNAQNRVPIISNLLEDEKATVAMAIWLEGQDSACQDIISGSVLDFSLFFQAVSLQSQESPQSQE